MPSEGMYAAWKDVKWKDNEWKDAAWRDSEWKEDECMKWKDEYVCTTKPKKWNGENKIEIWRRKKWKKIKRDWNKKLREGVTTKC